MIDIKSNVEPGKVVEFSHFCEGHLYYRTEDGTIFPIPLDDTRGATFNRTDKAIYFMRWMRKYNDRLANGEGDE